MVPLEVSVQPEQAGSPGTVRLLEGRAKLGGLIRVVRRRGSRARGRSARCNGPRLGGRPNRARNRRSCRVCGKPGIDADRLPRHQVRVGEPLQQPREYGHVRLHVDPPRRARQRSSDPAPRQSRSGPETTVDSANRPRPRDPPLGGQPFEMPDEEQTEIPSASSRIRFRLSKKGCPSLVGGSAVSTDIGDACRPAGVLPITMAVKCTKLDRSGRVRIADFPIMARIPPGSDAPE